MSSTTPLAPTGLEIKRQSDIISDLEGRWRTTFGANVNLAPESYNGQIIGIMSERLALVYELLEAIYNSQFPSGAEGTSVDNILALNGLKRQAATYTTTQPVPVVQSNGITLHGLVLTGTPGTTIPAGSQIADTANPPHIFALDSSVTISAPVNAVQTVIFSNVPKSGAYRLALTTPSGASALTAAIPYNALPRDARLIWSPPRTSGTYQISVAGQVTAPLAYNASSNDVAVALRVALGDDTIVVAGSVSDGMTITAPDGPVQPVSAVGDAAPLVVNSVAAAINSIESTTPGQMPFGDVAVAGQSQGFALTFGAVAVEAGQPTSGAIALPLITVASNTLKRDTTVTNISIADTVQGAPAQGIGSATATTTGPATVKANSITAIRNPLNGWAGVNNPLDCISGSNVESDSEALQRRSTLLASQAQGPLNAVLQRVLSVPGVTQALAFPNLTNAANQVITFGSVPTQGSFSFRVDGIPSGDIEPSEGLAGIEASIQGTGKFAQTTVSGSYTYGFVVDFAGSYGGQSVGLIEVESNTTGVPINVAFGRSPKSVEIVVQGGSNKDIAQAIYESAPAGIDTYASPVLTTTGSVTQGSATMVVANTQGLSAGLSVRCFGVAPGTTIQTIVGSTLTLSAVAISSYNDVPAVFSNATAIADSNGNTTLIGFSRPQPIPIYVRISLLTDTYKTPGVPSSGVNLGSKWSPSFVSDIQAKMLEIGNSIPIGGTIVSFGSDGLIGAFNQTRGIIDYDLYFGTEPGTQNQNNIAMASEQVPSFQSFNIVIDYR